MSLAVYQALVDKIVRSPDDGVVAADRDDAIALAVLRYSTDCPRKLVEDIVWTLDGYIGPVPAGWMVGSSLLGGEFPIGEQPPASIDIAVSQTPTQTQLMAVYAREAGDTVRVTYTAPHQLTAAPAADTIPDQHREAVANYAAFILFKQLAAKYSSDRETSINADHSDVDSRAKNYALRSKEARAAYFAGIGKADPMADRAGAANAPSGAAAAGGIATWEGRTRNPLTRGSLSL